LTRSSYGSTLAFAMRVAHRILYIGGACEYLSRSCEGRVCLECVDLEVVALPPSYSSPELTSI
jgi:hypothetical protein